MKKSTLPSVALAVLSVASLAACKSGAGLSSLRSAKSTSTTLSTQTSASRAASLSASVSSTTVAAANAATTTVKPSTAPLPVDQEGVVKVDGNIAVGPTNTYLANGGFSCGGEKDPAWIRNDKPSEFTGLSIAEQYAQRPDYRASELAHWNSTLVKNDSAKGENLFGWITNAADVNPRVDSRQFTGTLAVFASKLVAHLPDQVVTLDNFTCKGDVVAPNGQLQIGAEGRFAALAGLVLDTKVIDAKLAELGIARSDLTVMVIDLRDEAGKVTGKTFVEFKAAGCGNNEHLPVSPPTTGPPASTTPGSPKPTVPPRGTTPTTVPVGTTPTTVPETTTPTVPETTIPPTTVGRKGVPAVTNPPASGTLPNTQSSVPASVTTKPSLAPPQTLPVNVTPTTRETVPAPIDQPVNGPPVTATSPATSQAPVTVRPPVTIKGPPPSSP